MALDQKVLNKEHSIVAVGQREPIDYEMYGVKNQRFESGLVKPCEYRD